MMRIVSKLGRWYAVCLDNISTLSTKGWILPLKNSERAFTIVSFLGWLRSWRLKDSSKKIRPQPRKESRRRMRRKRKKKGRCSQKKWKKSLKTKGAKPSVSSLKNTPSLWLLWSQMEATTMTVQILLLFTTDFTKSRQIESFTSLMLAKESILRWLLLQLKRLGGSQTKDASTWASVSFWETKVRSLRPEKVSQLDFWICSTKPKTMLTNSSRTERKVRSRKLKVSRKKENRSLLPWSLKSTKKLLRRSAWLPLNTTTWSKTESQTMSFLSRRC